jgi:hypothetical protein
MRTREILSTTAWIVGLAVAPGSAQQPAAPASAPAHDATELAKQSQNPVGDLVSVPFQFNFFSGGDLEDQTLLNLNVQPVVPFSVGKDWKVIARTIVPINSFPGPDGLRYSGVGDIQEQLFLTPARPGGIIWGVGPMFSFPTATAFPTETGSWAAGVAAVVLKSTGPWVIGALVTQAWTFADAGDDTEVNQFLVQPFVNYNFGKGWAIALAPTITANEDAPGGEQWTVPLGLGISRTTVFNRRPMSLGVQYYHNVERPTGTAGQQLRLTLSLLYPAGH